MVLAETAAATAHINAMTLFKECSVTKVPQVIKIKSEIITRVIVAHLF
jgi:hypothetical protein